MTGPKLFTQFLHDNGITLSAAAATFGVKPPSVYEWKKGTRRPRDEHRTAIEKWTGGFVPAESWLDPDRKEALDGIRPFGSEAA